LQIACDCHPGFFGGGEHAVIYRDPDGSEWSYQIGDKTSADRTQARLPTLALPRVQPKIGTALRTAKSAPSDRSVTGLTVVPDELAKI
jgi:hypothetical protein